MSYSWDTFDGTEARTKVCESYFFPAGYQPGEQSLSLVRMVCTFVTVSIISSWYCRRHVNGRLTLFFFHWLG